MSKVKRLKVSFVDVSTEEGKKIYKEITNNLNGQG